MTDLQLEVLSMLRSLLQRRRVEIIAYFMLRILVAQRLGFFTGRVTPDEILDSLSMSSHVLITHCVCHLVILGEELVVLRYDRREGLHILPMMLMACIMTSTTS